jgi:hypothetical protein
VNKSHTYFALDTENFGAKIMGKVDQYESTDPVDQISSRLSLAWRYYFGYDPSGFHATSTIGRAGSQGELAEIRVNHSRSLVNVLLNLVTAQKLVWTPRATNIDPESLRQTEIAAAVLEYYWRDRGVSAYANKAVEEAIAFTEGFVLTEWDTHAGEIVSPDPEDETGVGIIRSGDIKFTNVSTWNVIRDPHKQSFDELDWVIVRLYRNKFELAARYPAMEDDILSARSDVVSKKSRPSQRDMNDSDDIPVYHFYHKASAALPYGRFAICLDNKTVLRDGPLETDSWPLHRVSPAELIGTPFAYSPYLEILGLQELYDSLQSTAATNLTTFGVQSIAVELNELSTPVDELAGGMRAFYYRPGGRPPEPLQLTKSPPELYSHLQDIKRNMELGMGLNAVVRGEAQSDKMSGAALALLQSQALQQASMLQGNYIRMVESIGGSVLDFFRKKATHPRKVAIVGESSSFLVEEAEFDDQSFGEIKAVTVEVGNPLSQTPAGRAEMAKDLLQMGTITTTEQYERLLATGRLETMTKGLRDELINVAAENQDISKGVQPIAMIHDNHLMHGKEHCRPVANPSARRSPPVMEAHQAHMLEHYSLYFGVPVEQVTMDPLYKDRMLILSGQQPPPPMMAPQAPPQGQAPPGPETAPSAPPEAVAEQQQPNMPNMPTNPATGQEWNPVDAGGMVPK